MDFLLIGLLVVLNGVFAMTELALAASRRARLLSLAEDGDGGAAKALELMDSPNQFLSTIQVGITSIGMLNGIIGEAAFSDDLAVWLEALGVGQAAAEFTATALVVVIITFITIIFGELVPKRIGQLYPEPVARWMSRPMAWLAVAAKPFVRLLAWSTQGVLTLLRIPTDVARGMTEEEIEHSLEEGVDAGVIEAQEHQMVRNVFRLDDRPLTSLMTPRVDIAWLDATLTVAQALTHLGEGGGAHSWHPVCRGSLDDVVGVISVNRLLSLDLEQGLGPQTRETLASFVEPAVFVPETLSGMELVEQFRARSLRMVFVVDEYGAVQGLLTPADLLEAITGELQSATPVDAWATQRDDGSWLLDGMIPVDELKTRLDIEELPGEDKGRYNTVAGLLQSVSGRLPKTGERITCAGWEFEVVDLDGWRIDKVLATRLPEPEQEIAATQ